MATSLRLSRRHSGLVLALSLALVSASWSVPAQAASLSELKAELWVSYRASGDDYRAARTHLGGLPRSQVVTMQAANASGWQSLTDVGPVISAVNSWDTYRVAEQAMTVETLRSGTLREVASRLPLLLSYRSEQGALARTALDEHLAGRLTPAAYAAVQARLSSFSTRVAADSRSHLAVAGRPAPPPILFSSRYLDAIRTRTGSIPVASAWTGFAGGCALPAAGPAWRPRVPADRPAIGTNPELVATARSGVASTEPLRTLHRQMLETAARERTTPQPVDTAWQSFGTRAARLGYAWLAGDDQLSRAALQDDVRAVVSAGPDGMNSLRAATVLGAVATGYNWTAQSDPLLQEQVSVRWLGPATCAYADQDGFVTGETNIPVVQNSNYFLGGAVFLEGKPEQSAALARAALTGVTPGLSMLARDGGTYEGPGYWNYQSRSIAVLHATLPNVYPTAPVTLPSLATMAAYARNSANADGTSVPFADSAAARASALVPAWYARSSGDPATAAWVQARVASQPDPHLMWWWTTAGTETAPRSGLYPSTGLAVLHRAEGTVTLKGGKNGRAHGHLDIGSVSVQRKGVDWAVDPGMGDYAQPGYFDAAQRWTYWHPSTAAHSTLIRATANQGVTASSSFSGFTSSQVTLDMTGALPGSSSARRTVTQYSGRVDVRDEVRSRAPINLEWRWTTDAAVTAYANRFVMEKDGQTATVSFIGLPSGYAIRTSAAPGESVDGRPLTVVSVHLPKIQSLVLTASLR